MTAEARTYDDGVAALATRMKSGSGPQWELTNTVAQAIHESGHRTHTWDHDRLEDQWLAVGTWRQAEAVVRVLPMVVLAK